MSWYGTMPAAGAPRASGQTARQSKAFAVMGMALVGAALVETYHNCYDAAESRELLWAAESARPGRAKVTHFPTVLINGKVWQEGATPNTTLTAAICASYSGPSKICSRR